MKPDNEVYPDREGTTKSLGELLFNEKAKVTKIQSDNPEVRCRLLTLGLYPGVEIEVLRRAPMGDPLQVRSGTTLLSIRQHEADGIEVEPLI
ncbi:MAG: ferrous iron transport protein A [Gammaproteobacteria bacterium]|nr:ferrous iron transport protein A [Gammaproteobacteria bacterium]